MNILVIEDDEETSSLLRIILEEEGHEVKVASDALPAFEILRRGAIDVILMDLGLPRMDGLSFTRKLKTYPQFNAIPIVAMTGMPGAYLSSDALRAGCDVYLEKPVRREELLETLASLPKPGETR